MEGDYFHACIEIGEGRVADTPEPAPRFERFQVTARTARPWKT